MSKIKRLLLPLLLLSLPVLLCSSCDDDGYVYPSVLTEFVEAHISSSNVVDYIITDEEKRYTLGNTITASSLQADSCYRSLCIYEITDEETSLVKAYSVKQIYASTPITEDQLADGVKTDPLSIQSMWRGGSYLNIIALPKAQNISHIYYFIQDSVTVESGSTKVYLKLYHDQNGDLEAYSQKTYLSVPLKGYSLQEGDSIYFSVNTYDDGLQTWKFAY